MENINNLIGENEELYYKRYGIETEKTEIKQVLVVPKGENCDGCLHCTTKLKQYVNMFGDPTRTEEEYYCDFFNQTLYENGKEFCCKKSVSKCFQCKLNFTSEEKKNSDMAQMILLYLLFAREELKDKITNKTEENKDEHNSGDLKGVF